MVKLDTHPRHSPKQRRAARKATSALKVHNLSAFITGCQAKIYLQVYSLAHFRANARPLRHTEPDNARPLSHTEILSHTEPPQKCSSGTARAGILENFTVCMSNPPLEIQANIHLVFYPPGQGLPLASPRISQQCCPPSRGELTGCQQEPHAVHGPFLQLRHTLPPAEERTGSPGRGHRHAKRQSTTPRNSARG